MKLPAVSTKEQIEDNLKAFGAEKDDKVPDVWHLNGHMFMIVKDEGGEGWHLDEL